MTITLYNTLSRRKEVFEPIDPERVTMYVCGPTVYSHPHIGNARPPVVFDVLYRLLKHTYPQVVYARNITDVEDKINAAAKAQNVAISVITDKFTAIYHQDMQVLGVLPPDIEPRATEHIDGMINMISRLIEAGNAYETQGHVLFEVASFADYGKLSRRNCEDLLEGARVEIAAYKKHPADFVLWKPSDDDTPGWESPWGRGRPGWHIECSAMIEQHLGRTIDIHGGGHDLIFPHHENESAQSCCSHGGAPLCRYWLHNGFINVNAEKMAKSVGNVLLVKDLLESVNGETVRMALLSSHYRKPLDWNNDTLIQAKRGLDRLYFALRDNQDIQVDESLGIPDTFLQALKDDLNTPKALSELFLLARQLNTANLMKDKVQLKSGLLKAAGLLGLAGQDPEQWFASSDQVNAQKIEQLIAQRSQARKVKDFATADAIRSQLDELGVDIEDTAGKTRWKLKNH